MTSISGNVLLAQGGGPSTTINVSLSAAFHRANQRFSDGSTIFGAHYGMEGLIDDQLIDLRTPPSPRWDAVARSPGAALGSSRKALSDGDLQEALQSLQRHDIRYVAYIGGNGSMRTLTQLAEVADHEGYELHLAGIPNTIDNDLTGTDFSPGYGSCARAFAQAVVDLSIDIRTLPAPVSIIEVMGRRVGWLTAATVLARDASASAPQHIFLPERPVTPESFLSTISDLYDEHGWVVVAIAEGLRTPDGEPLMESLLPEDARPESSTAIGNTGTALASLISSKLQLRARCEKPGLTLRAAAHQISGIDRQAAAQTAACAIEHLAAGGSGFMAGIHRDDIADFRFVCRPSSLDTIADRVQGVHDSMLDDHGQPNEAFLHYARPLIGGPLRRYQHFLPEAPRP